MIVLAVSQAGYFQATFGEAPEESWTALSALVSILGLVVRVATIGYAPVGTAVFPILRTLKRHTGILTVAGR